MTNTYDQCDEFTKGYIEAAFWTESDEDELNDLGVYDIAQSSLDTIVADCKRFQEENADSLALAYTSEEYDASHAGHDYWLTRNGHGAGFWERQALDEIDNRLGDRLTVASGSKSIYVSVGDDKQIHFEG